MPSLLRRAWQSKMRRLSPLIRRVALAGLPVWFAIHGVSRIVELLRIPGSPGFDARLYHTAAGEWLAGRDPWSASLYWDAAQPGIHFAGPPPTLIPFILLAPAPAEVVALLVALSGGASMLWALKRLGLPIWWMLFPPIVEGLWVGNLNVFVLPLLVGATAVGGALAALLKAYAGVPLLLMGDWRAIGLASAAVVGTAPFLPWAEFLAEYPRITSTLAEQAWGGRSSPLNTAFASVGGAIALVLLGRPRAIWLAVPVLWPATQLHYSILAVPALSPGLAAAAAVNTPGLLALAVMGVALWERYRSIRAERLRREARDVGRSDSSMTARHGVTDASRRANVDGRPSRSL